jgi:SAM-dependent methyltransferase
MIGDLLPHQTTMNSSEGSLYVDGTYAALNPTWHEEDAAWKASQIWKILQLNGCSPRRIVDVGCGTGGVLAALLDYLPPEAEAIGYDISPQAVGLGAKRQRRGLSINCADFTEMKEEKFDLLLSIDVFEHVENYIQFLRLLRGRAEYYVFHIPLDMNIRSLLRKRHIIERNTVGHLHYFDPTTARATLQHTGYHIIDSFYTTKLDRNIVRNMFIMIRKVVQAVTTEQFAVQLLGDASLLVLSR